LLLCRAVFFGFRFHGFVGGFGYLRFVRGSSAICNDWFMFQYLEVWAGSVLEADMGYRSGKLHLVKYVIMNIQIILTCHSFLKSVLNYNEFGQIEVHLMILGGIFFEWKSPI
jgi:hypothetical protein